MALEAVQAQAGHASRGRRDRHKARVTTATLAHRLGTLRMFFVRIDEWGWDEAPARVPMFPGERC
jgi:hypothetical protein